MRGHALPPARNTEELRRLIYTARSDLAGEHDGHSSLTRLQECFAEASLTLGIISRNIGEYEIDSSDACLIHVVNREGRDRGRGRSGQGSAGPEPLMLHGRIINRSASAESKI